MHMICRILFIFLHIFSHFQNVTAFFGGRSFLFSRKARYSFEPSQRIAIADPPFIEDVLERYSHIKNTTNLALGSSYWKPPDAVSESLKSIFSDDSLYRYGNLMGLPMLISRLKCRLEKAGLKMDNQEMVITSGANQALSSVALTLCDPGDNAVLLAPFYFCHKQDLQLANVNIHTCPFNPVDLKPQWDELELMMTKFKPKMLILTSPNNPSGIIYSSQDIERLISLCRKSQTWLLVDETYHEIIHSNATFEYPCSQRYSYDRIVHVFSMSKTFGMPGFRVGFTVFPRYLLDSVRKIQDIVPTHAPLISQYLALRCIEYDEDDQNPDCGWVAKAVKSLSSVRDLFTPFAEKHSCIVGNGAFYYLFPIPALQSSMIKNFDSKIEKYEYLRKEELRIVDHLANRHKILVMPGHVFGAPGYLRISYGCLAPHLAISMIPSLCEGILDAFSV